VLCPSICWETKSLLHAIELYDRSTWNEYGDSTYQVD
jgi:hypothetical protein